MGNGKRASPGERGKKTSSRKRSRRGLKLVEVVAELVHNHVSLKEIAGLTDRQLAEVYFRKRDKYGKLVRGKGKPVKSIDEYWGRLERMKCPKTKSWQKSSLSAAFRKVWKERGLTDEEVQEKWREYVNLPKNRSLKVILEQNERVQRMMGNGSR